MRGELRRTLAKYSNAKLHTFRVESTESKAESEAEWLRVSSTSYVSFFKKSKGRKGRKVSDQQLKAEKLKVTVCTFMFRKSAPSYAIATSRGTIIWAMGQCVEQTCRLARETCRRSTIARAYTSSATTADGGGGCRWDCAYENYPRRLRASRRSTDVREFVGLEIHKQYVCALLLVLGPRREPGAKVQGMHIPTGRRERGCSWCVTRHHVILSCGLL